MDGVNEEQISRRMPAASAPRKLAGAVFGVAIAAALGGILGIGGYLVMRRRGTLARHPRIKAIAAGAGSLVLIVGLVARGTAAVVPVASCQVTDLNLTAEPTAAPTTTTLENVATAAPTGLALIYAAASGATMCTAQTGELVAARDQGFVATVGKGAIIGEVFLSWNLPEDQDPALAAHENRHVAQWTVSTVIGGPLAFPVAYSVADFFFPGGRNPFERDAGLAAGQYDPNTPFAPVLGTPQIAVLLLLAAGIAVLIGRKWLLRRRDRRSADAALRVHPAWIPASAAVRIEEGRDSRGDRRVR